MCDTHGSAPSDGHALRRAHTLRQAHAPGGLSRDTRGMNTHPDSPDEPASDPAVRTASLQPARRAVLTRHVAAAAMVAGLLAVFLAATVLLPPVGALLVGVLIAAAALWAIRRATVAAQSGLVATGQGLVLRLGTASAEISWDAIDVVRVLGDGRLVAVEVAAGRLRRQLPRAYARDDVGAWLRAAADLAVDAGHDHLRVRDGELGPGE